MHWDQNNLQLGASIHEDRDEWEDEDAAWRKMEVIIQVPFSRTTAHPDARRYIATDLYHRPLVSVIWEKLSNAQDDEFFHYEPYHLRWSAPHLQREVNIQGELYTSPAFMDTHRKLQESPGEPGSLASHPYPDLALVILIILAFPFALYLSLQQSQYIWLDPFADEAYPCSVPPPD
ncbi:uncharacterized protein EDB93DRAFT_1252250 [Suillus bovinus]|uniref:uncharacterized protein n=1 Tax=Suillus bovinus TaxID=48563 RepID=UPI001B876586|nr:uncharacterized protein EDB93DRAFT_1252250 [Suillus bovinus]KAG2142780.1 hypothetical protein EDB93DRAFT_1252250 [Suillus bovinus]